MAYIITPPNAYYLGTPLISSQTDPITLATVGAFNVVQNSNNIVLYGSFGFDTTGAGGGGIELDFNFLPLGVFNQYTNAFYNIVFSNSFSPFILPSNSFNGQILINQIANNIISLYIRTLSIETNIILNTVITLS